MSCLIASAGRLVDGAQLPSPPPWVPAVSVRRLRRPRFLHDPCGSVSTRSTDRRRSCHSTATAIAVVVFPDPPFCPAKAMITTHTYHRHPQTPNSICNRPRTSTDACRRSLASMSDTAIYVGCACRACTARRKNVAPTPRGSSGALRGDVRRAAGRVLAHHRRIATALARRLRSLFLGSRRVPSPRAPS